MLPLSCIDGVVTIHQLAREIANGPFFHFISVVHDISSALPARAIYTLRHADFDGSFPWQQNICQGQIYISSGPFGSQPEILPSLLTNCW